jgi:hypothetical protein
VLKDVEKKRISARTHQATTNEIGHEAIKRTFDGLKSVQAICVLLFVTGHGVSQLQGDKLHNGR